MSTRSELEPYSQEMSVQRHGRSSHGRSGHLHSPAGESAHSISSADNILGAGVIFLVVFTALAHGTVEPWSIAILEVISALLIAVWAAGAIANKHITLRLPSTILPLAALLVIAAMQCVSLTEGENRISFSMDVEATRSAFLVFVCLVALVALAGNFLADKERLRTLAQILAVYGFALALFALLQHMSWNGRFYWIRPNTHGASPFGPFVNHNNFAGYMELLIPVPLALALTGAVHGETRLFYGFAAAVMSVSCVASLSRGGMISLASSVLFLLVMKRRMRGTEEGEPRKGALGFALRFGVSASILAAVVGGVIWVASDSVVTRVIGQTQNGAATTETFNSSRGWLWRDTLRMIEARPVLGVGFGAFSTAYPIYSKSDGSLEVDRAHNDYLQILSDCGVIGGIVAVWFIIVFWRGLARAIRSHDRFLAALSLGCGSAVFALLVHSIFDFNLQLPANALLFLLLSAIPMLVGSHMVRAKGKTRVVLRRSEEGHVFPLAGDAEVLLTPAEDTRLLTSAGPTD